LVTNQAINRAYTQHKKICGKAAQNPDDHAHKYDPNQFKAQLLWGCAQE
jgi:hypothetical protein